jgi:hypothetical protein
MENTTIGRTICKIAVAGERAGFTVEQMIELLNNGLDVPTLVSMIEWKLNLRRAADTGPQGLQVGVLMRIHIAMTSNPNASSVGRPLRSPNAQAELLARAINAMERSVRLIECSRQLFAQRRSITSTQRLARHRDTIRLKVATSAQL